MVGELERTTIYGRRVGNACRRPGGTHHVRDVYEATATGTELRPDPKETKGVGWYTPAQLQALADRTGAFLAGEITAADWDAEPGLEEVRALFLEELGYIQTKFYTEAS